MMNEIAINKDLLSDLKAQLNNIIGGVAENYNEMCELYNAPRGDCSICQINRELLATLHGN